MNNCLILLLILFFRGWNFAQPLEELDFSPKFRCVIGMHPLNVFRIGDSDMLPIHLESQVFLKKNLTIGASFGYDKRQISERQYYSYSPDSLMLVNYNGKARNFEYLVRANYYFQFSDVENWILKKLEPYLALGVGIGLNKNKVEAEFPQGDYPFRVYESNRYFAHQVSAGLNYNYGDQIGFYFETGIAMAKFQIGVSWKL